MPPSSDIALQFVLSLYELLLEEQKNQMGILLTTDSFQSRGQPWGGEERAKKLMDQVGVWAKYRQTQ